MIPALEDSTLVPENVCDGNRFEIGTLKARSRSLLGLVAMEIANCCFGCSDSNTNHPVDLVVRRAASTSVAYGGRILRPLRCPAAGAQPASARRTQEAADPPSKAEELGLDYHCEPPPSHDHTGRDAS